MESSQPIADPPRTWPWTLAGLVLTVSGPLLFFWQLHARQLRTPWYLPLLATLGLVCFGVALRQRWSVARLLANVIGLAWCILLWYVVYPGMRTPTYSGPIQVGAALPAFEAQLASGAPFTPATLQASGKATAMVFFRGRW